MSLRFLPTIAALVGLMAAAPAAHARLGETLAQCTERYGAPRATPPSVIAESDPEAARFEQGQLSILVHFHQGVAWHVSYAQGYLSDLDKDRLLKENASAGEWQPRFGELSGNVLLWHNQEAKLVACGINRKSLNSLEVMTRPCAEAFGRARTRRLEEAAAQSVPQTGSPAAPAR